MAKASGKSVERAGRGRLRAFRPLLVWCCLAASLLGWDTYRRFAAGTTLTFRVLVENQAPANVPIVQLDGVPFQSGHRVSLGKRTLTVNTPGLEPYERRFRVWFGRIDLGDINLTPSKGTLVVVAEPLPREITVTGAAFNTSVTNTVPTFDPLPVGSYRLVADYGLFKEERKVEVQRNETIRLELKPAVGTVELTSQPTNANYRLRASGSTGISLEGALPARFDLLPPGEYQLSAWRGDYSKESRLVVKAGETNRLQVEFA